MGDSPLIIKNCGLNSADAVQAAVASGADFLGFISYPDSPRHTEPEQVKAWLSDVPSSIQRVSVLVNPSDEAITAQLDAWSPSHIQLHGDETPERVAEIKTRFGLPLIKAIAVRTKEDIAQASAYEDRVDFLLFDTKAESGVSGGTGKSFDWSLLQNATFKKPYFLSGGLHIDNIAEALRITHATHIDISSGLESARGVKSPKKITAFNQFVRKL